METKQIDPQEAARIEHEKRIDFYLKKKNLGHIKTNLAKAIGDLELQMEKDGVTYQDLQQQRASEEVLELAQQAVKYQYVADAVLRRAVTESAKNKEFEDLEKEFQGHRQAEIKTEEGEKAYKEAQERYKINPTPQNFKRMTDAMGVSPEFTTNGGTLSDKEKMRATEDAMREQYQKEAAEQEAEESQALEKLSKSKDPLERKYAEQEIQRNIKRKEDAEDLALAEAEAEAKFAREK
jgi:hypothetical protein